ncbi:hypothetical protein ASPACDRAFT_58368 [Aspergillus aculeatus ATCC 16872]|uniref:Uncharacterized protein n=1 Tax=Aspergillus aculeatus (strain ATCC 16872 / CBS 172.66 / WB 5094) TaxID=690307 RepID=A0A1L9X0N2_ASPA1|nr:uncharacterized protein ASPACDRAFT_58368 [Aspergillus aculeatus ATCC 16872]OJK01983.1 hypothetical protein ASPACDRAFT_58368 [Aspergillus aculeatus ATCC 16872]
MAVHLSSEWMRNATANASLFHATLFSASASIDILRGSRNNRVTLYHQTCAIRLLNQTLNKDTVELNYAAIGTVVPLIFYNMVALDIDSAVAHQKGLTMMLLSLPTEKRDELGPLLGVIKLALLSFSCIFDVPPAWDCLTFPDVRPHSILRSVIASMTQQSNTGSIFTPTTVDNILDIYAAISQLQAIADHPTLEDVTAADIHQMRHLLKTLDPLRPRKAAQPTSASSPTSTEEKLNVCCSLATSILSRLLRADAPLYEESTLQAELNQLTQRITEIDAAFWIRRAPETLTWLIFTGAATAPTSLDRGRLILYGGTVLTAVDSDKLVLVRQGWVYLGRDVDESQVGDFSSGATGCAIGI